MIKLNFITPTIYIERFSVHSDFILALSHLIDLDKENDYEKAIKETNLPIILDNGLFENNVPEQIESLIKKAIKIKAKLFFAPDVLYDTSKTRACLKKAIIEADGSGLEIGAIVQASNKKEYIEQLLEFNFNPYVKLIGLSILAVPKSFGGSITESRINLMKEMIQLNKEEGVEWKPCHLLGIGNSYKDIVFARDNCPWIVSNDSSSAFQTALHNHTYDGELEVIQGKVKEKVNFELNKVDESTLQEVFYNIKKIKSIIQK